MTMEDRALLENGPESHLATWHNLVSQKYFSPKTVDFRTAASNILATALGFSVSLPYINSAKDFAEDNETVAKLYAISEFFAIGFLTTFLFRAVFNYALLRMEDKRKLDPFLKMILIIVPVISAAIMAIPNTIVGLIYNDGSVAYAALAFMGDFVAYTYAVQRILRERFLHHQLSPEQKRFLEVIVARMRLAASRLSMSDDYEAFNQRYKLTQRPQRRPSSSHIDNLIAELVGIGSNEFIQLKLHKNQHTFLILRYVSYIIALLTPIAWLIVDFHLTYTQIHKRTNSPIGAGIVAALSSAGTYMLAAVFAKDILQMVITAGRKLYNEKNITNHPYKYQRTLYMTLETLALVSASLAYASRAQITSDQFSGKARDILLPWVITANMSMKLYSVFCTIIALCYGIGLFTCRASHVQLCFYIQALVQRVNEAAPEEVDHIRMLSPKLNPADNAAILWHSRSIQDRREGTEDITTALLTPDSRP